MNMGVTVLNSMLNGAYATEYFSIQRDYAENGDIKHTINKMVSLAYEVYTEFDTNATKIQKFFRNSSVTDGITDMLSFVVDFFVPRDNLWGKIVYPFYSLGLWCIYTTSSVRSGLFLIIIIFTTLLMLCKIFALFIPKWKLDRGIKSGTIRTREEAIQCAEEYSFIPILVIISLLLLAIYIISLVVYVLYLSKPIQENLFVFQYIYGRNDVLPLIYAYSNYTFKHVSLFFLILTFVLYLYSAFASAMIRIERFNITIDQLENEGGDKAGENAGALIGGSIGLFVLCAYLDINIIYALFGYALLNAITNTVSLIPPLETWIVNNFKKVLISILLLFGVSYCSVSSDEWFIEYKYSINKPLYSAITTLDSKSLNIRKEPDANSPIIGSVQPKEVIYVYQEINGFAKIRYHSSTSEYGYVSLKYITPKDKK
jgi:uncharacterized protein YgiM (DUF1202 family)